MSAKALPLEAAVRFILEKLTPTDAEQAALAMAPGRTLAGDVRADGDLPRWDNSAMDGYACRADDVRSASPHEPVSLQVLETIGAGSFATAGVTNGTAIRIMTGAPIPEGADSVVRVEDTDGGADSVLVHSARDALANIRRRGEDIHEGEAAVRGGTRITVAEVALLGALARSTVSVHRRPRVAVLSSGDELVAVGAAGEPSGARLPSANGPALMALVQEAGGEAVDLGIVDDDLDATVDAFARARGCDLLLTSGGISVGGFDYTRRAVEAAGGTVHFWRVAVRPGYNTAFGSVHGVPWIGVPGNPVSALVAGELFARPAIRRLSGARHPERPRLRAQLAERRPAGGAVTVVLRAALDRTASDLPLTRIAGAQGSGILSTSARADALLIVPPGEGDLDAGTVVDALVLRDELPG